MNILVKTILATLSITYFSVVIASGTTTEAPGTVTVTEPLMVFQVIQKQLAIDSSMIESATIVSPQNLSDTSYGLQLKLKDTAANELTRISGENVGKHMNIVLNGVVISSPTIQNPLGAEFQISGLTKEQAERFIKGIELSK